MKILLSILTLVSLLVASNTTDACKKCHPVISEEFQTSMHKKSTIHEDKVHAAIWNKHPAKAKGNYKCAKCHTPNIEQELPHTTGITCVSCHTIMDVEQHSKSNNNIYSGQNRTFYSAQKGRENEKVVYKESSSWFGLKTTTVGSAYHDIDYTNKIFYTGKVCMGCHSHKQNSKKLDVCSTDAEGVSATQANCITCHMPKVGGSATTVRMSKQHAFHGFAGARVKPELLSKYVTLNFTNKTNSFDIQIKSDAPHNLLTHPLRVVQLRVTLIRDAQQTALKTHTFIKVIGKNGKPSMPWVATEIVKDTMIKANEKRVINFDTRLQSGDTLEVKLGFFVVNPKALKKLNLQDEKELRKFTVLQSQYFKVD